MINLSDSSFFYRSLTEEIGKKILEFLSLGSKSHASFSHWDYPFKIDSDEKIVNWCYDVKRLKHKTDLGWDIYATAGPSSSCEPSIEINVFLNKGTWVKNHKIDKAVLYGVIAHEIHHIAQGPDLEEILITEDQASYFLDPREREAFQIGFRAQSFYSGVPMIDCMKDYLLPRVELGILTKKQAQAILDAWVSVDWPA